MDAAEDEIVAVLPIHYSNAHSGSVHLHQFPLLTRTLQAPPSAVASGKYITARLKPAVRRLEIHVPADTRSDVWSVDRAKELGNARGEDDREKNQEKRTKMQEAEGPRLSEARFRSEEIVQRGCYVLGMIRNSMLPYHRVCWS
jgi:DNA-directed RNA polymerase III subunit RPC5